MTRIAIDATSATMGGGLTYLSALLRWLPEVADIQISAVLVRSGTRSIVDREEQVFLLEGSGRFAALDPRWQLEVQRRADVVFAPTEVSFAVYRKPLVLALRNACLARGNPCGFVAKQRVRNMTQRTLACWWSTRAMYVANSQHAKRIGVDSLGIPAPSIKVVYPGSDVPPHSPRPIGPCRRFIFVSHGNPYKGLQAAIRALSTVGADWHLDVVGSAGASDYFARNETLAKSLGIARRISFRGTLGGRDLSIAYAEADCLLWPSTVETFGHPLIEAHRHGLPIIAADAASNREIAGDAAYYYKPQDLSALRALISTASEQGLTVGTLPRDYSWGDFAARLSDVLGAAART